MVESTNQSKPDAEFEVNHVFGYRTENCQQNLHYNSNGEAVFMVAALGIVQNTETGKQRFYGGGETEMTQKSEGEQLEFHRDDIICIDMCSDRRLAITGQVGKCPSVHVWDSHTCTKISSFVLDKDSRGVQAVSISPCKKYVACVDQSNDHKVFIYNIERQQMLLTTAGGKDKIVDIQWSKRPDDLRFATVSTKDLRFWYPADVTKKLNVKGTFQMGAMAYHCLTFDEEGWCYVGTDAGVILVWNEQAQVAKQIKVFAQNIMSVNIQGDKLVCGSKDAKVAIISVKAGQFKLEKTIDLEAGTLTFIKSIDYFNNNLLIGQRNGTIMEYKNVLEEGGENNGKCLMQSHFEGEMWGLSVVDQDRVLTTCDDNQALLCNFSTLSVERSGKISDNKKPKCTRASTAATMSQFLANKQARAITHSSKHNHVVICSNFGKVSIRDFNDMDKKITSLKEPIEWCEVAVYSPDESMLAIGSHCDNIFIYSITEEGYKLYCKFQRHSSFITSLDWSLDGSYIRSTDGAHERLFYSLETKQQDTHGQQTTVDREWASQSVKIGSDREGCRPAYCDKTHINDYALSPDGTLLVTCDDYGLINVFNYPVDENAKGSGARSYAGHSEHVVRAQFSPDGQYLYSVGGQDKALIQWKRK